MLDPFQAHSHQILAHLRARSSAAADVSGTRRGITSVTQIRAARTLMAMDAIACDTDDVAAPWHRIRNQGRSDVSISATSFMRSTFEPKPEPACQNHFERYLGTIL